jgi:hypothetical protein
MSLKTVFIFSIKQRHTLGKTWGLLHPLFTGKLIGSQYASVRSCDRSSRHKFSWFSFVFKQILRWFQVPSCYWTLLIQPSLLIFNSYSHAIEAKKILLFLKYSSENKKFPCFCLKILLLVTLTSSLAHYPYQKEQVAKPRNLLIKQYSFSLQK